MTQYVFYAPEWGSEMTIPFAACVMERKDFPFTALGENEDWLEAATRVIIDPYHGIPKEVCLRRHVSAYHPTDIARAIRRLYDKYLTASTWLRIYDVLNVCSHRDAIRNASDSTLAHVPVTSEMRNKGLVAYFASYHDCARERATCATITRWLSRFAPSIRPHEAAELADKYAASLRGGRFRLIITRRVADVDHYYSQPVLNEGGHRSCMSYHKDHFKTAVHPACAYVPPERLADLHAGHFRFECSVPPSDDDERAWRRARDEARLSGADLAVAFMVPTHDPDTLAARAVVWPLHETYVRPYGAGQVEITLIEQALQALGFERDCDLGGARVYFHANPNVEAVPMPYIDGQSQCVDYICDAYGVIGDDGPTTDTSGRLNMRGGTTCECCGARISDDDGEYEVRTENGREIWCQSCHEMQTFYCEYSHETWALSAGYIEVVTARGIETWSAEYESVTFRDEVLDCTVSKSDFDAVEAWDCVTNEYVYVAVSIGRRGSPLCFDEGERNYAEDEDGNLVLFPYHDAECDYLEETRTVAVASGEGKQRNIFHRFMPPSLGALVPVGA